MSNESLWEQWLVANPNRTICTHYHEAFNAGAEAMRAECIRATEQPMAHRMYKTVAFGIRERIKALGGGQ